MLYESVYCSTVIREVFSFVKGPVAEGPRYMLYPAIEGELLAVHVSSTVWGVVPVPVKPIEIGELEASLVIVTLPATAPVADGANITLSVAV